MRRQAGITYLAVLLLILVMEATVAATAEIWHIAQQREKERELLFVGNQFRQAIALYYERTTGPAKQYPKNLDDLLADQRFPNKPPYLRKIFYDPMTKKREWGLVTAPSGEIMGVHSLSQERPLKMWGFPLLYETFEQKISYSEWEFVYIPMRSSDFIAR